LTLNNAAGLIFFRRKVPQWGSAMNASTPDRRTVLTGAAAALAAPAFAKAQPPQRFYKTIPSTGIAIPAVGMGSWLTFDVGANAQLRAARTEVLREFFRLGGAVIDSSPMYGTSQAVIGHALDELGRADRMFAADKVWIGDGALGPAQIDESARRWGVDNFDLLQVHNLVSWRAHLETLFAMKAEGRLAHVGVTSYSGHHYDEMERILRDHPLDFIQLTYNMADRRAENRLLPLAQEKGAAVIANRPFGEGAVINAAKRHPLPDIAAEIGAANWAQFLLKFIISHPAITAAIPATRRVDHMRENMGALSGSMPDRDLRLRMVQSFDAL